METNDLVSKSLEILRGGSSKELTDKTVDNISYVSYLPYLGINPQHPLSGQDVDEIKDVKEVFDYFNSNYKEDSFNQFMKYLNALSPIPESGITKSKQILKFIKMKELSNLHKIEHEKLEARLTGIPR